MDYIMKWKERCYFDDIPDEVPRKVMDSLRAPSYRAIAECLLKNDFLLIGIGGVTQDSKWADILYHEKKACISNQMDIFSYDSTRQHRP